ncbi:MAG TPA: 2-amino-4-hydroxy-6-hydroxymethyldihydropteridine diphosphokinase, partial [Terriglobia bacterium]|nr:2-amino-4-hydroxy-6-hydroxymethyldihydropteridine diphosphokinase [Terriglobia bacterium]
PRPIDIDILFYNELRIQTPELTVPHPRYSDRRFVLLPLAELLPDFRDPIQNISVQQLIERCPDKGEVRFHAPPLF